MILSQKSGIIPRPTSSMTTHFTVKSKLIMSTMTTTAGPTENYGTQKENNQTCDKDSY